MKKDSQPPKDSVTPVKGRRVLLGALVLASVAGGAGGAMYFLQGDLPFNSAVAAQMKTEEKQAQAEKEFLKNPPAFVELQPFIANLASGGTRRNVISMTLSVEAKNAETAEDLKGFLPAMRHEINLLLAATLAADIATPEGQQQLATKIKEALNKVLSADGAGDPDLIRNVVFNSLIVK